MTTLKKFTIILTLLASTSPLVFAQDESAVVTTDEAATITASNAENSIAIKYSCAHSGQLRRVEVEFESANAVLPCSVTYHKDTETQGEVSTLWSATNQVGYCETKAAEFVEKLRSWGWVCTQG